ncbi:MAG: HAD-IA family hydrolase [Defluviitaleaceae bacterium]|nr:HAD-IA family hydrolase [Defluviitaleaceae bacterium]
MLCLFDLDGTITDSKEGIVNGFKHALNAMNIDPNNLNINKFLGPPLRDSFRKFCGMNEEEADFAVSKYREYFNDRGMLEENKVYPEIREVLEILRKNGVRLTIATSKPTVYAEKILKYFGLDEYFEMVVGAELNGERSTKKEIIACILENTDPKREMYAVMIGDRIHDAIGAKIMGIPFIAALWGYGEAGEFDDLSPDFAAENPSELVSILLDKKLG